MIYITILEHYYFVTLGSRPSFKRHEKLSFLIHHIMFYVILKKNFKSAFEIYICMTTYFFTNKKFKDAIHSIRRMRILGKGRNL